MTQIRNHRWLLRTGKVLLVAVALYVAFTLLMVIVSGGSKASAAQPSRKAMAQSRLKEASTRTGVATTRKKAVEDQEALEPYVQEVIDSGGAKELVTEEQNPSVIADLQRLEPKLTKGKLVRSPGGRGGKKEPEAGERNNPEPPFTAATTASRHRHSVRAHASACYGSPSAQWNYTEAGKLVAWIYVRVNSWCGNPGVSITWSGGPSFANWHWGPFCLGTVGYNWSWDYYPRWIHTATWASQGVIYPWGCFTYNGGKAVIRIAASGYHDEYNDYGF